jgi:PAS domain S-box-containing protein
MNKKSEPGANILVVEDELIIAKGIEKRLLTLGYSVAGIVQTGEAAVEMAVATSPDLVLMDICLHDGMDGVTAAQKIAGKVDIPVVYLTAYADPDTLERAKLTGPFGYIVKPFQDVTLKSAIEMALYKHRMEKKLRNSEQWLATILRSIGDAVIATDTTGSVTYMNPVAEELTGWVRDDAMGRPLAEVFSIRGDESVPAVDSIVSKVIRNGAAVTFLGRTVLVSKDGKEVPVEAKATPFSGVQGGNSGLALVFIDITERVRVEEALRRSERLLFIKNRIANVFLTVPDEEMYSGALAVVQEVMGSSYGLFGYIDDDGNLVIPSLTKSVWEECNVYDKSTIFPRSSWGGLWGRALKEKRSFLSNEPLNFPQGHVATENFLAAPILYRGETIGIIAVGNRDGGYDDSERKVLESIVDRIAPILDARLQRDRKERERNRAEEALRRSEQLLRSVFNAVPDLITIVDKELKIVMSNWGGGYDYVPEEIRQCNPFCYKAYYGTDRPCEPCHAIEVFKSGKPLFREKNNPRIGTIEIYAIPICDETGNIVYVVESGRDITHRKKAEEALAAEKERLAVTLRSIGDGVITTDVDGRILLLNRVAEGITGWGQEEAIGKPFCEVFNIINEKTRKPPPDPVQRVLSTGVAVEMENHTVLISRDGAEYVIADSGAPIRDQLTRIIGAVVVFRDITEKRKMEQELLKAQQLESIGVLAGGIAHDFNNLLTAILGNISLAKILAPKGEKIHMKLIEAENASMRARDLTQQLLTFSRGGAPVKKTARIDDIIRDSASFTLSGSHSNCRFDIESGLWPVEVDSGQISQVINNLIINADQAMPGGGVVDVTCRNVTVGDEEGLPVPKGRYIAVSIRDHGVGIPPESIERIFEPYFTTKKSGKGLGLATVYSIVRNHKGYIEVSSIEGEGTTFTFYLPCVDGDGEPSPIKAAVPDETSPADFSGKVLVMDDEENIRDVAGEMLDFLGYKTEFAGDGAEAVEIFKSRLGSSEPFAAVLMDLTVQGGMGGKEAMELLMKLDPGVKVIASSGYSNDPIMADYKSYGFSGIISKPYQLSDLKQVLAQVLGRSSG